LHQICFTLAVNINPKKATEWPFGYKTKAKLKTAHNAKMLRD
jgi:hypothetical protein